MRNWVVLCAVLFITLSLTCFATAQPYQHQVEVKDMSFSWKIEGDTLHAKMSAKTEGWVGVGFNPSDKMKDANFILGYVKNGKAMVVDHFGDRTVGHSEDTKKGGTEDVTLVSGSEENRITTIEFIIPLDSGDKLDGTLDQDGDTMLLLSYGPDRDSFKTRHKFRDSMTVNLTTGAVK